MPALFRFEGKNQPLLSHRHYIDRVFRNLFAGLLFLLLFWSIGILGYHITCGFSWIDSLLNAAMILSGMGPVQTISTTSGKWFAAFYALASGVVFITTIGIMLAPVAHRIFHRFHLEASEDEA